ncbi:MAG: C-GCAxxG-C-C family protein [Oscillospiraceae bacterium]
MEELQDRIESLMSQGFSCSQIMMILSMEQRGMENPELVRAMGGLAGGLHSQSTCGTLTGACCMLASYGAKGTVSETASIPYKAMVQGLVHWFGKEFGSTVCRDLLENDKSNIPSICPKLMAETFAKCMELLTEQGIDIEG